MKRRINIECYDEEISTADAVAFVLGVIKKGITCLTPSEGNDD